MNNKKRKQIKKWINKLIIPKKGKRGLREAIEEQREKNNDRDLVEATIKNSN